jgi:hypothetical protein
MEIGYGIILTSALILGILAAGCIGGDTQSPVPIGGNPSQTDVPLQNTGDVIGQGVILQGVPRGTIDTITFAVGLSPGTKSIDFSKLIIIYADAVRTENLAPVPGFRGDPPPGYWGIIQVVNEAGNPNTRLEYDEQAIIRINPKAPVVPNQVITISVKPEEGKPLIIRRVAPSTILENENIIPPI